MSSRSRRRSPRRNKPSGFTLVEILVVIAIVLLASLVALPVIYSSLSGRQITDAARIFTGGLVGIRDSAIRYNEPRGIRLLPDPVLTIPAPGTSASAGMTQLVYNRFIPIEPAGDYAEGKVTIGPQLPVSGAQTGFPPLYPRGVNATDTYPFFQTPGISSVLMIEESPYQGGLATPSAMPNSPTSWYWNVRVGDKIKIGGTGRSYTIVGPCTVSPWGTGANFGNPELFVNVGAPGTTPPLSRRYYSQSPGALPSDPPIFAPLKDLNPEFLFVVNGEDDVTGGVSDGYVDAGWDGYNNDGDTYTDELDEWESEKWVGAIVTDHLQDTGSGAVSPTPEWITKFYQTGTRDVPYIIQRRPIPSPGAREVMLPAGMVIDATTWNSTQERSRIPVEPGSLYCDIMVNPGGLYVPTTAYSVPASAASSQFLHFWLTERSDVHPVGTIPASAGYGFSLPMPADAMGWDATTMQPIPITSEGQYYPAANGGLPVLKGDRRLVTMFAQSGLVTTGTIETIPPPPPVSPHTISLQPGEGFTIGNVGYPFLKAQQGLREPR